jgi:hypothetical protein
LKDRGRNTRRPSTPRGPHLHVFASDYEWVVASSAKDAASFMLGECGPSGDPDGYDTPDYWSRVADSHPLSILDTEDTRGPKTTKTTKTCGEWARSNGRGFLCSTEW